MNANEKEALLKAMIATAEVMGGEIKPTAAVLMVDDLAGYSLESCLVSLKRCRQEVSGRLTLAAIIERLSVADGRPTANEAWALALKAMDESETVVLNNEISQAMDYARDIFNAGDEIGARMAFRDSYERIAKEARENGTAVNWWPSLGHDVTRREAAIQKAISLGKLSQSAMHLLPEHIAGDTQPLLLAASERAKHSETGRETLRELLEFLGDKKHTHLSKEEVQLKKIEIEKTARDYEAMKKLGATT